MRGFSTPSFKTLFTVALLASSLSACGSTSDEAADAGTPSDDVRTDDASTNDDLGPNDPDTSDPPTDVRDPDVRPPDATPPDVRDPDAIDPTDAPLPDATPDPDVAPTDTTVDAHQDTTPVDDTTDTDLPPDGCAIVDSAPRTVPAGTATSWTVELLCGAPPSEVSYAVGDDEPTPLDAAEVRSVASGRWHADVPLPAFEAAGVETIWLTIDDEAPLPWRLHVSCSDCLAVPPPEATPWDDLPIGRTVDRLLTQPLGRSAVVVALTTGPDAGQDARLVDIAAGRFGETVRLEPDDLVRLVGTGQTESAVLLVARRDAESRLTVTRRSTNGETFSRPVVELTSDARLTGLLGMQATLLRDLGGVAVLAHDGPQVITIDSWNFDNPPQYASVGAYNDRTEFACMALVPEPGLAAGAIPAREELVALVVTGRPERGAFRAQIVRLAQQASVLADVSFDLPGQATDEPPGCYLDEESGEVLVAQAGAAARVRFFREPRGFSATVDALPPLPFEPRWSDDPSPLRAFAPLERRPNVGHEIVVRLPSTWEVDGFVALGLALEESRATWRSLGPVRGVCTLPETCGPQRRLLFSPVADSTPIVLYQDAASSAPARLRDIPTAANRWSPLRFTDDVGLTFQLGRSGNVTAWVEQHDAVEPPFFIASFDEDEMVTRVLPLGPDDDGLPRYLVEATVRGQNTRTHRVLQGDPIDGERRNGPPPLFEEVAAIRPLGSTADGWFAFATTGDRPQIRVAPIEVSTAGELAWGESYVLGFAPVPAHFGLDRFPAGFLERLLPSRQLLHALPPVPFDETDPALPTHDPAEDIVAYLAGGAGSCPVDLVIYPRGALDERPSVVTRSTEEHCAGLDLPVARVHVARPPTDIARPGAPALVAPWVPPGTDDPDRSFPGAAHYLRIATESNPDALVARTTAILSPPDDLSLFAALRAHQLRIADVDRDGLEDLLLDRPFRATGRPTLLRNAQPPSTYYTEQPLWQCEDSTLQPDRGGELCGTTSHL